MMQYNSETAKQFDQAHALYMNYFRQLHDMDTDTKLMVTQIFLSLIMFDMLDCGLTLEQVESSEHMANTMLQHARSYGLDTMQ
jgi:hypothetical protein